MTINELIAEIESIHPSNTARYRAAFIAAFELLKPKPDDREERKSWVTQTAVFLDRLDCLAYESAAVMLVPGGYVWGMDDGRGSAYVSRDISTHHVFANDAPLALLICCLEASQ